MIANEFSRVLRETAEQQSAVKKLRPCIVSVSNRLRFSDVRKREPHRSAASQSFAMSAYLRDTTAQRTGHPADDAPPTLDDLKRRVRAGLTRQQAAVLRRQFARHYHPDRTSSAARSAANALMAEANVLLDEACSDSDVLR